MEFAGYRKWVCDENLSGIVPPLETRFLFGTVFGRFLPLTPHSLLGLRLFDAKNLSTLVRDQDVGESNRLSKRDSGLVPGDLNVEFRED